jgi:hypothetical protein
LVKATFASSKVPSSKSAASELIEQLRASERSGPSALVVFASPDYDHESLLESLTSNFPATAIVGSSSAGEFAKGDVAAGVACLGLSGDDVEFQAAVGTGLRADVTQAARRIASTFKGSDHRRRAFSSALVLTDALAGHASGLIDELTLATGGQYSFFGGGAGDNARFAKTPVFHGSEVLSDAAVALEILSDKPIGVGAVHGWEPASRAMRVTETRGMSIVSIDGFPARDAFERHAAETNQNLEIDAPIPFFLHNVIGIRSSAGHWLRVPLAVEQDGAIVCASEVPTGSIVQIMRSTTPSAVEAAKGAAKSAMNALGNHRAVAGLFFDCVATRLRLGDDFGRELAAVKDALPSIPFTGCNTHGQIVRAEGQFDGFHNCTAVVCVFPA